MNSQDVIKASNDRPKILNPVSEQSIPYTAVYEISAPKVLSKSDYKKMPVFVVPNTLTTGLSAAPVTLGRVDDMPVMYMDESAVKRGFDNKSWTKPKPNADGTYPQALPAYAFKTVDEFRKFLLELHYLASTTGETDATVLTNQALKAVGKQSLARKKKTEEKNKKDAERCGLKLTPKDEAPF